jgi:hypothetical protein
LSSHPHLRPRSQALSRPAPGPPSSSAQLDTATT